MKSSDFYEQYKKLFDSLRQIIKDSKEKVLDDPPDEFIVSNINFFVKSYLINICTYLEAYLQDIAFWYVSEINNRLKSACIPHNFIQWRVLKEVKEKDLNFKDSNLVINKKEISENLSANIYKTIKMFRRLGIDLKAIKKFQDNKNVINMVVTKRNNIIHHNDNAVDISFSDLLSYIDVFIEYMKSIDDTVLKSNG